MQSPPEKLGAFYLGAEYDLDAAAVKEAPVVYDARDLVTHAVCVGMTGSGKTGLCVGLLEEAALDRVPAIIIDPKGDMTNLLLQFPDLLPQDFKPWVNAGDAERKGKTVDEFAESTATQWKEGLAGWGIGGDRIKTLIDTVDYTVFTPGSDAGVPVNIMGSLAAPDLDWLAEGEAIRERINGTVAALMGLAGINEDTVRSREAILMASIFEYFWKNGEDLDLAKLILSIQNPPVKQVGVFDVDTFFPAKDRFNLAMAFNNIMAAPTFQSWLAGEPLDVAGLLYTAEGKPRHSIFYIAHLSDAERMFFVTLLLENVLTWVRRQSGTTSLRALLYFDEIFGYFPPSAQPPSKRPLLTLMKQARAFGLGVVLVTQNPVDLDYKGLTNAGTWLIGKLQAERDKARVLEGLQGALSEAGSSVEVNYDELITRLGSRIFLMHNVHADKTIVFNTRWAQSYLRGPLTKTQVRDLMAPRKPQSISAAPLPSAAPASPAATTYGASTMTAPAAPPPVAPAASTEAVDSTPEGFLNTRPVISEKVEQVYVPVRADERAAIDQISRDAGLSVTPLRVYLTYEPAALGATAVHFTDRKREISVDEQQILVAPAPRGPGGIDWDEAEALPLRLRDLIDDPERVGPGQGPFFAPVPEGAKTVADLKKLQNALEDWLYYNARLKVNTHDELEITQRPGESERDFRARLEQAGRERRDAEVDKLEDSFGKRVDAVMAKLAREQAEMEKNRLESQTRQGEQWVTVGETVLGWFMGRKRGVSSSVSKYRQAEQAKMDVLENERVIKALSEEKGALEADLKEQTDEIARRWTEILSKTTQEEIAPRRTDVEVELMALAWLPSWVVEYELSGRTRQSAIAAYPLPAA